MKNINIAKKIAILSLTATMAIGAVFSPSLRIYAGPFPDAIYPYISADGRTIYWEMRGAWPSDASFAMLTTREQDLSWSEVTAMVHQTATDAARRWDSRPHPTGERNGKLDLTDYAEGIIIVCTENKVVTAWVIEVGPLDPTNPGARSCRPIIYCDGDAADEVKPVERGGYYVP